MTRAFVTSQKKISRSSPQETKPWLSGDLCFVRKSKHTSRHRSQHYYEDLYIVWSKNHPSYHLSEDSTDIMNDPGCRTCSNFHPLQDHNLLEHKLVYRTAVTLLLCPFNTRVRRLGRTSACSINERKQRFQQTITKENQVDQDLNYKQITFLSAAAPDASTSEERTKKLRTRSLFLLLCSKRRIDGIHEIQQNVWRIRHNDGHHGHLHSLELHEKVKSRLLQLCSSSQK